MRSQIPINPICHILDAAFVEVAPELVGHCQRHGGVADQVGRGAIVAGQHNQRRSGFNGHILDDFQAVGQ
jgi:hypothetical protein